MFLLRGRHLLTPRHDILLGITRETVTELAPAVGLTVEAADLELCDAYTANEAFLVSTAGGVVPISMIDGRPIGSGQPGPVFRDIRVAYERLVASERYGTPVFQ